jgi:TonB family protein
VKKPDPPKPPPKPPVPQPKKTEFQKGKRVEAKPQPPRFEDRYTRYDPSKPVSTKPVTDQKLSREEIEKALRDGARVGARNSIPEDEVSRCVLLVRRALHEAWEQPGAGDAGPRPALLDIRLDSSGRIVSYRIRQSSGSAFFDQTVLKAAANAQPIRGLTLAFLKQYETLTVEFKLE